MTMVVFAVGLFGIHGALAQHDYDAKTVETIGGKVLSIEKTTYHLKNPFFALEKLEQKTRYCFASTRIARQTFDGHLLSLYPVAYLLGFRECNDDYTNYRIFTDEGLKRLIDRTG
jgi:hypothetical protein